MVGRTPELPLQPPEQEHTTTADTGPGSSSLECPAGVSSLNLSMVKMHVVMEEGAYEEYQVRC
jgi:hypothetical protein